MRDRISSIVIPNDNYSYTKDGSTKNVIDNLSKINIIVGENNSGKSRFLRDLMNSGKDMKFDMTGDKEI